MKRRKKIWIACAALGVVVALCAFVWTYRPMHYRFLDGAVYEGTSIAVSHSTRESPRASHRFRLKGTWESALSAVAAELSTAQGWKPTGNPAWMFSHTTSETSVVFYRSEWVTHRVTPGAIYVYVNEPATTWDRILNWLHAL